MKKNLVAAVSAALLLASTTGASAAVLTKLQTTRGGVGDPSYGYGNVGLAIPGVVERVVPPDPNAIVAPATVPDVQVPPDLFAPPVDNDLGAASTVLDPLGVAGTGAGESQDAAPVIAPAGVGTDLLLEGTRLASYDGRFEHPGFAVPEPRFVGLLGLVLLGLTWLRTQRAKPAVARRS